MADNTHNSNSKNGWKKAIEVCKKLAGIDYDKALTELESLGLDDNIKIKSIKILAGMKQDHKLLDSDGFSSIFNQVKEDNDLIGKMIGSYKIVDLIAKGGMSSIYKAAHTQEGIQKPVALKILSPYAFADKAVELFKREQLILSQLEHPNIVSFHLSGKTEDGTNYLVMDYIDGAQTITDYCTDHHFTIRQIVQYTHQLAKVFTYSHSNFVIHRDIKPSNLLVDKQGNIKVIDFGIAQINSNNDSTSTKVFTLDMASPEQIMGENVNIQTDVFSLGAVLLQLLVNEKPLPKTSIANYQSLDTVKHVSQLLKNSKLDTDLKNIVLTATHIDRAKRYASMELFAQDLDNWQQKKTITATADSKTYRIKKFILRNPLSVTLSVFIFLSMLISMLVIQNYASSVQKEIVRTNKTMDFLTHIFDQADPFQSGDANITLIKALDSSSDLPLEKLGGDEQLKKTLHLKLGEIYYNLGLDERALHQYRQALVIMNKNKNQYELDIIKTKILISQILVGMGQLAEAVKITEGAINVLDTTYKKKYALKARGYAVLLKAYQQNTSGSQFNANNAEIMKHKLTSMITTNQIKDNESKLAVLNALAIVAVTEKQYDLAEKYNIDSMKILEFMQQENSVSYNIFKMNLAYNYIQQKKYLLAEGIMTQLIEQIQTTDPNSYFLSGVYENYATLFYKTGREAQCLEALSQSVEISTRSQNPHGLYQSIAKRAMYYNRYNHFKLGLLDQLELIPITIQNSKVSSPQTLSHLANLALMFHSANRPKTAQQIFKKTIELLEQDDKPKKQVIESYYLISGISNWHANLIADAIMDYQHSQEYTQANENPKAKILKHLILTKQLSHEYITSINPKKPVGSNLDLYQNLFYLLQLKDARIQLNVNEQELNHYCQMTEQFTIIKTIAIKQIFLSTCSELYHRYSFPTPKILTDEINDINSAINETEKIPKQYLQTKISAIWTVLNQ